MVNSDIWIILYMNLNNMNKEEKLLMYHGAHNTYNKNSEKWWYQHKICFLRSLMLIVGDLIFILIKCKITLFKIGKIDTFIFINLLKFLPETISKLQWYQEFMILCIVECMLLTCFLCRIWHSLFQITVWVLILPKELDFGILFNKRLDKIFILLKRPFGKQIVR